MKIRVFDPPMCCPTGVCGPSVDPELARFAADLDWLKRQGIEVERNNLTQQPKAFTATPVVMEALDKRGNGCLPLTMADGKIVCEGRYPTREMLAGFAGLDAKSNAAAGEKTGGGCCGGAKAIEGAGGKNPTKKSSCC